MPTHTANTRRLTMNTFTGHVLLLFFMFFVMGSFTSCSGEISGTITVKGNMPHTYLALTAEDGNIFRIRGKAAEELRNDYQGSKVTIKGKIISMPEGPMPGEIEVFSFTSP